jgi:hypothetical protein
MSATRSMIIVAVLVIALGIGWLLNTLGVIPGVDWLWTGGLGVAGILIMAADGINKFTFVVGSFHHFWGAIVALFAVTAGYSKVFA